MHIDKHVPTRPGQFVLRTTDPTGSAAFYGDLFGWSVETDGFFLARGHAVARTEPGSGGWLPYLAVADLDSVLAAATGVGATSVSDPADGPTGRSAIVVAPGGADLGLWQVGSGRGVEVMAEPGAVVWVEDKTHHQAADTTFLSALFGFEVFGPVGPGAVRVLRGDGPLFGGVMQFDDRWAADQAPHWLLYFQSDDVEATTGRAAEVGGSVWFPPFDTPLGRMSYVRDPDGNAFAVVTVSAQGRAMTGGDAA